MAITLDHLAARSPRVFGDYLKHVRGSYTSPGRLAALGADPDVDEFARLPRLERLQAVHHLRALVGFASELNEISECDEEALNAELDKLRAAIGPEPSHTPVGVLPSPVTLDSLAATSANFAVPLSILRREREPCRELLAVDEADRVAALEVQRQHSAIRLWAWIDALFANRQIDVVVAGMLQGEVSDLLVLPPVSGVGVNG